MKPVHRGAELTPMRCRCGWDVCAVQRFEVAFGESRQHTPRCGRSYPGHKLEHSESGHGVPWVLRPTKHTQNVFHMCGLKELQTAIFCERDVSPGKLDLERGAVVGSAEQDRLAF